MIVGGQGHSTDHLRRSLHESCGWLDVQEMTEAALFQRTGYPDVLTHKGVVDRLAADKAAGTLVLS